MLVIWRKPVDVHILRPELPEKDRQNRTGRIAQPDQDRQEKTSRTEQAEQGPRT
jgi:hypothetical protein